VTCDQSGAAPGERTGCVSNEASDYLAPVAEYVQFLKDLKGPTVDDDHATVVAGIHGLDPVSLTPGPVRVGTDPERSGEPLLLSACAIDGAGGAAPGVRLSQFLAGFPDQSATATICDDSLADALTIVGDLVKTTLEGHCIDGALADVNPDLDGDQYECAVSLVSDPGTAQEIEHVVPPCAPPDDEACWELLPTPWCEGPHLRTNVRRPPLVRPRTFARWQCRSEQP
jgi:hypothetical protein